MSVGTDLGREYIDAGIASGVAIDLCHLNETTALQAAAHMVEKEMPPLLSHADCFAIHPIPRNVSDAVLERIKEGHGVFGVSALAYSIGKPDENSIEQILKHIEHAVRVAGPDCVGLGLDYWIGVAPYNPGWVQSLRDRYDEWRGLWDASMFHKGTDRMAPGIETPAGIHNLAAAIRERFSVANGYEADVADKILGGNMVRVLSAWWKPPE